MCLYMMTLLRDLFKKKIKKKTFKRTNIAAKVKFAQRALDYYNKEGIHYTLHNIKSVSFDVYI